MSEQQAKARAAQAAAQLAAEADGLVPISAASLNALAAAYWQWQGAQQALSAATNVAQAKLDAYVGRLQTELDALGLEEVRATGPRRDGQPGEQVQVEVDFRRGVLVLPPPEAPARARAPAPAAPLPRGKAGDAAPSSV